MVQAEGIVGSLQAAVRPTHPAHCQRRPSNPLPPAEHSATVLVPVINSGFVPHIFNSNPPPVHPEPVEGPVLNPVAGETPVHPEPVEGPPVRPEPVEGPPFALSLSKGPRSPRRGNPRGCPPPFTLSLSRGPRSPRRGNPRGCPPPFTLSLSKGPRGSTGSPRTVCDTPCWVGVNHLPAALRGYRLATLCDGRAPRNRRRYGGLGHWRVWLQRR